MSAVKPSVNQGYVTGRHLMTYHAYVTPLHKETPVFPRTEPIRTSGLRNTGVLFLFFKTGAPIIVESTDRSTEMFWRRHRMCRKTHAAIELPASGLLRTLRPYFPKGYPINNMVFAILEDWLIVTQKAASVESNLLHNETRNSLVMYSRELSTKMSMYQWEQAKALVHAEAEKYLAGSIDGSGWRIIYRNEAYHVTHTRLTINGRRVTLDNILDTITEMLKRKGISEVDIVKLYATYTYRHITPSSGDFNYWLKQTVEDLANEINVRKQNVHTRSRRKNIAK